jgi:hypothetical protein
MLNEIPAKVTVRENAITEPMLEEAAEDMIAVVPIGDHHVGMLSWKPETGASYDLKKAEALLKGAFDAVSVTGPQAATCLIVNLGDFYHANDLTHRTPRSGFTLDVDGRMPKVIRVGVDMLCYAIDRALETHKQVIVWNVPGNHDPLLSIALSIALEHHYLKEERVHVEPTASMWYAMRFGRVLLSASHGHTAKDVDVPGIIAANYPQMWGATTWRRHFRGHVHHSSSKERHGLKTETFGVLAPADAHSASLGFGATERSLHRLLFHRDTGPAGRFEVHHQYIEALLGLEP